MPPPTFVPPYISKYRHTIDPYGQQPIMNANDYIAPRQPSTSYNPQNPHGRHYPEYSQPQTNPNNPVTPGGYGNYIAPPPVYYPSASYDYYGQYPVPPPHHPPPNPYGYPGPVFFFDFFLFFFLVTYILEATHVIFVANLNTHFIIHTI